MAEGVPAVLDPEQLRRIESTHRGFLYQHLYAAGCLLLSLATNVDYVAVERDEDIEIKLPDRTAYLQVKTRLESLRPADIATTLERFDAVRQSHAAARAPAGCEFWIVSNADPAPSLRAAIAAPNWPSDVRLLCPSEAATRPDYLPAPWTTVSEAINWCSAVANCVPAARISGETLTWKLAALVQLACTGTPPYAEHRFDSGDLPDLFEQVAVQLHRFPDPPEPYWALHDEPPVATGARRRLIVGLSGSGKTSWAAQTAAHVEGPVAYFDLAGIPSEALTSALSRELAAQLLSKGDDRAAVLAPGLSPVDACRALNITLERRAPLALVVLDNAHSAAIAPLHTALALLPSLRVILLCQPGSATNDLEAALGIIVEPLPTWSIGTIAAAFAHEGCAVGAEVAERMRRLTGGLPLFVRQAASLTARDYGRDAAKLCDLLESRTHAEDTRQERILSQSWTSLALGTREAGALLSLSDVPLTIDECRDLLVSSAAIDPTAASANIRSLSRSGLVQVIGGSISMHDALRLVARREADEMPTTKVSVAREWLRDRMEESIKAHWDFGRLVFYLRLLPRTGRTDRLVSIATGHEELFAEFGITPIAEPILEDVVESQTLSEMDRFWALDTLAYWSYQKGEFELFDRRVDQLDELCPMTGGGSREQGAIALKKMLRAGRSGQVAEARKYFAAAQSTYADDPVVRRVFKYDFAVALFKGRKLQECESLASELVAEYYEQLGLRPEDVAFKNIPDIAAKLPDTDSAYADVKRLADTLELYSMARSRQGKSPGLARIHAHKFFAMAQAYTSAVRVGQDVADELLEYGDADGAREILEKNVLPIVQHVGLLGHVVSVRAQYAVVLAYCGEQRRAVREIENVRAFAISAPEKRAELDRQCDLVHRIVRGEVRLGSVVPSTSLVGHGVPRQSQMRVKVGRNDPCPCRSGLKYKRCCGR